MKNIKKLLAILTVAAILTLSACEDKNPPRDKEFTAEAVYQKLVEAELFEPPYMLDISEDRLPDFNVNPDDTYSFIAKEAGISSIFAYLIIIHTNGDKLEQVYNDMIEFQKSLKDAAFYPQGFEAAASSIVDFHGNYVYLICVDNPEEVKAELLKIVS